MTFVFYTIILTFQKVHIDFKLLNLVIPQIVQEGQLIYSLSLISHMYMNFASIAIELIFKVVVYQIPLTFLSLERGAHSSLKCVENNS